MILKGPGRGLRFVVSPGMGAGFALTRDRTIDFWSQIIRPGMTVWDIGANKGQSALPLSRLVGPRGHVISFEPVPSEHAVLQRNLELNDISNVETRNVALSNCDGQAEFCYSPSHSTQGRLISHVTRRKWADSTFMVETCCVDTLIALGTPEPAFLKIDVEGSMALVLDGAKALLHDAGPPIYAELHNESERKCVDHLFQLGYHALSVSGAEVIKGRPDSPLLFQKQSGDIQA